MDESAGSVAVHAGNCVQAPAQLMKSYLACIRVVLQGRLLCDTAKKVAHMQRDCILHSCMPAVAHGGSYMHVCFDSAKHQQCRSILCATSSSSIQET